MPLLATPRLHLRRFRPEDAAVLAAYRSVPGVARYQGWSAPVGEEEARLLVREFAAVDPEAPGWFQYAVEERATGALVGDVGVRLDENGMQADLGFTLAPAAQGRGYATEAVRAVLGDLFERRGLHRVSAVCDARNTASAPPRTGRLPPRGPAPGLHLAQGRVDGRRAVRAPRGLVARLTDAPAVSRPPAPRRSPVPRVPLPEPGPRGVPLPDPALVAPRSRGSVPAPYA
ncbi:GNAT family N-acetyltransferase [Streptomyces sp. NPDC060243]|uniref:GNAT family N-acetyltransferase n=1 Tax=Streptomyces sp. NPDC060243 TaxID=3347081 RepID=UPI00365D4BC9